MKSVVFALIGMMSLPAWSAEISFQVSYKNYDCVYVVDHLYASNRAPELAIAIEEAGNAAQISTSVQLAEHQAKACLNFDYLQILVNENWMTSHDLRDAKKIVSALNNGGHQQIQIDGQKLMNSKPASYTSYKGSLNDTEGKSASNLRIDRATVQLSDLPNYQNFLKLIKN